MLRLFSKLAPWIALALCVCALGAYLDPLTDDLVTVRHRGGQIRAHRTSDECDLVPLLPPDSLNLAALTGALLLVALICRLFGLQATSTVCWWRTEVEFLSPSSLARQPSLGRAPPSLA